MGCAYPLMFSHVLVAGDPPFKKEPLPDIIRENLSGNIFIKKNLGLMIRIDLKILLKMSMTMMIL